MSDARDLAREAIDEQQWAITAGTGYAWEHMGDMWRDFEALARAVLADDTADRLAHEPDQSKHGAACGMQGSHSQGAGKQGTCTCGRDDLLDRLARVEAEAKLLRECDCVAAVYSSLSCRKCGRPNVITAEMAAANDRRFGEMALRRAAVGDLARRALELYERTLDGCEQYTSEEPEHECFDVVFPALARAVLADETATCACGKDIWDAAGPEEQDSLIASGWHPGDPRECPVHGGRDIADDTADPDYSPAYQDEYQRLWHESAERLKEMAQWLADAQTEQLEIARLFPDAPVGASNLECVRSLFDWLASEKAENTRLRKLLATDPRAARSMCACAERCGDVPESEDHPLSVCKKLPR